MNVQNIESTVQQVTQNTPIQELTPAELELINGGFNLPSSGDFLLMGVTEALSKK